ncbi:MAG: BREX-3 system phosphatase PglZ [Limnochordia bacterium]|nr:BREX-3 system phosphatase PglZ [Limnochordia bacterium]
MSNWQRQVLKKLVPSIARLFIVSDPDGLLFEEEVFHQISGQGFHLVTFEDSIAFRYLFETKYRPYQRRGEGTLIVRYDGKDLDDLPADLLQKGHQLYISLGELFPDLNSEVVAALDRGYLDLVDEAVRAYSPHSLSANETKDFILRHVFKIVPDLIKTPADLLHVLLRRHYLGLSIPKVLDEYFIEVLQGSGRFAAWPLEEITSNRERFFSFLQERWPVFLEHLVIDGACEREESAIFGLKEPVHLPFDHSDVRVYVDSLFIDGHLQPVTFNKAELLTEKWVTVGIKIDPVADRLRRLKGLTKSIERNLPDERARHQTWLTFAYRWAELTTLTLELINDVDPSIQTRFEGLQRTVDERFSNWVKTRFAGLYNQPPNPPVMVHHIPRSLARKLSEDPKKKLALIVIDGLALDQWLVIRNTLQEQSPGLEMRERTVFAWLPTITQVSRQALFAGKPPFYFPKSIGTTKREPVLWQRFWKDQGLTQAAVKYEKGLGQVDDLTQVREVASQPTTRVMGLVINTVDNIMHGMELGALGMHNQVRQWAESGYLARLIALLLDESFEVVLTSDHGSCEAQGQGRPNEGVLAEARSERVRVFSKEVLRQRVAEGFPNSILWPPVGLPEDYLALMASDRYAFVHKGKRVVAHGGISLEEVIVPYVHILGRTI